MGNSNTSQKGALLIQLDPQDNIAVLAQSAEAGTSIEWSGGCAVLPRALGLGHKICLSPIAAGEQVVKYGAPIGSATRDISPGEHIHLHNMQSDYLPTYHAKDGQTYDQ